MGVFEASGPYTLCIKANGCLKVPGALVQPSKVTRSFDCLKFFTFVSP